MTCLPLGEPYTDQAHIYVLLFVAQRAELYTSIHRELIITSSDKLESKYCNRVIPKTDPVSITLDRVTSGSMGRSPDATYHQSPPSFPDQTVVNPSHPSNPAKSLALLVLQCGTALGLEREQNQNESDIYITEEVSNAAAKTTLR